MSFKTRLDFGSNNRQAKQFQFSEITLSGKTTFGVDDVLIPENFTGDTINIETLQYIKTRGIILANPLPTISGGTTVITRDDITGKIGSIELSGLTNSGTTNYIAKFNATGDDIIDSNITDNGSLINITGNLGVTGNVGLNNYGNGTVTGATTYSLAVDASGNVIESALVTGFTPTSLAVDYSFTDNSANWDTAYTNRITSLTTTGSSGTSTLISNVLNVPNYTLSGLGGEPDLGNPASDGMVLSSTAVGIRSWVELSGGTSPSSIGVTELKPELKSTVGLVGLNIDWSLGIQFTYTMTSATSLTFSNILQGKTIMLIIDGNYTLTLPTGVNSVDLINFDGTKTNYIQIYCADSTTPIFLVGLKNY